MNAPIVHIQYDQVRQVAQRLQRQREAVQTLHQRILRTYQQLTQGAWEGAAATRWAAEMQAEIFPALTRAVHVLGMAQTVALDMVTTFDAAEQEAARLFQGELHAVAVGGFSGGNAAGNGGLRQAETPTMGSSTTFVAFTPTPEETATPTPEEENPEEQERQALITTITQLLTDRGIPATPNGSDYGISTLPLDAMTLADLTQLHAILSSDIPQLLIEDSLVLMDTLQAYWGYDTITMVQALRELYYPTTLDAFIPGAGVITESILQFTPNPTDPISTSQAAYAYTLFQLSRQRTGYVPALVPITRNGKDFGLDHVISALDAYYHPTIDLQSTLVDLGLEAFGLSTIQQREAVTWQGDLGGAVHQGLNAFLDLFMNSSGYPDLERCANIHPYDTDERGYCTEMPYEDIEGDVMGIVVTSHAEALGLAGDNPLPLGTALAPAYAWDGAYYPQRYNLFAAQYGLEILPTLNMFTTESVEAFVAANQTAVAAYGIGLFLRQHPDPGYLVSIPTLAKSDATEALYHFVGSIQSGLAKPGSTDE